MSNPQDTPAVDEQHPDQPTGRPAWPVTLAGLLHARPELRGVGISASLEGRWTA